MPRSRRRHRQFQIHLPNFNWLYIILGLIFWSLLVFTIIMIDPDLIKNTGLPGSYLPFFILVFGAFSFTLNFFIKKLMRSLLYAASITICLYLQLYHLLNLINFLLIIALIVVLEFLFGALHPKSRIQKVHSKHPQTQSDMPTSS